jgi:hypothetical protein
MRDHECAFEQDVLDAVQAGRWPHRTDRELVTHAATCPLCADLVVVATAMGGALVDEDDVPRLPTPGSIWWRAQRQARLDAARRAALPLRLAQWAALVCVLALTTAFGGYLVVWFGRSAERVGAWLPQISEALASLDTLSESARLILLLGSIAVCLLAPAAVYVSLSDPSARRPRREVAHRLPR